MTDTNMTKIDQSKSLNNAYRFGFQEITVFELCRGILNIS